MEKRKTYIVVGSAVAVLIVLGVLFAGKENVKAPTAPILGLSANTGVMCTQEVPLGDTGNSVTTTLYFYKDKMRYDTSLAHEAQGQKDMHAIRDGAYVYVWGQGTIGSAFAGKGIKIDAADQDGEYEPPVDVEELKANDYQVPGLHCEAWTPDPSMFELPNDVEFVTEDELTGSVMAPPTNTEMPGGGFDACAACEMIPDANAKAECKQSCGDVPDIQ